MDTIIAPARANPDVTRGAKRRGPRAEKCLTTNETRILAALRAGAGEAPQIAKAIGVNGRSIYVILARLIEKGLVRRQAPGWYELTPPKPIGVKTLAAMTAGEPSIIRPIPHWRRMAGR